MHILVLNVVFLLFVFLLSISSGQLLKDFNLENKELIEKQQENDPLAMDTFVETLDPKLIVANIDPGVDPKESERIINSLLRDLGRAEIPLMFSRKEDVLQEAA